MTFRAAKADFVTATRHAIAVATEPDD